MKKSLSFLSVTISLLLTLILLTSCALDSALGIEGAEINDNGELILSYTDGSEQNLGVVVGSDGKDGSDGENGYLNINTEENAIAVASAKGLRSAVSIECKFQAEVQLGGWRPGMGSTTIKDYSSEGSGVIYKLDKSEGDAFIITNYHVVYDSSSNTENGISHDISVYLYGSELEEKAIKASYVGGSLYYDIAVLRIEDSEILKASDVCAITSANSDEISVGDRAIAIGNAKGYGISASSGIVSVDSEYITMTAADGKTRVSFRVMRVDTAVNSGNSGGGLFDEQGNLIGIVNAKIVDDGVESIGYAIPANVALSVADNVIDNCFGTNCERVKRPLHGITVSASDSKAVYNSENGLIRIVEAVSVYEVSADSLADGVLMSGDIIVDVSINEVKYDITRQYQVIDLMLLVRVGDVVKFNILREGKSESVSFTVTEDCMIEY